MTLELEIIQVSTTQYDTFAIKFYDEGELE